MKGLPFRPLARTDQTYSFRAPVELAQRLHAAQRAYVELGAHAPLAAHITREMEVELQRRLRRPPGGRGGRGRILRDVAEAFVAATESARGDEALAEELRAFDGEDRAGHAERAALLRGSAAARDA
jgi:hypothetical protein